MNSIKVLTKITRNYKDKEGIWKETNSYKPSDLSKLILATQKAYEHISLTTRWKMEKDLHDRLEAIEEILYAVAEKVGAIDFESDEDSTMEEAEYKEV